MKELADYVRLFSRRGRLVTAEQVAAVAGIHDAPGNVAEGYATLVLDPDFLDIQMRPAEGGPFFFSHHFIVDHYAEQWLAVHAGNLVAAMANQVRRLGALGELVSAADFRHPPYELDDDQLDMSHQQLLAQHEDIGWVAEGGGYFFYKEHFSQNYARTLAEHDPFEWSA